MSQIARRSTEARASYPFGYFPHTLYVRCLTFAAVAYRKCWYNIGRAGPGVLDRDIVLYL